MMLTGIGLLSGTIFGLFLKLIEQMTNKKVYTLLLNIDYIPLLKELNLTEGSEFGLHLIVSVFVTYILFYGLKNAQRQYQIKYYVVLNMMIAMMLYGTTVLSERTPNLFDLEAQLYWFLGHILFGTIQGWLITKTNL